MPAKAPAAQKTIVTPHRDGSMTGVFTIVLTVFTMALADGIVKLASDTIPLWQITVLRALVAIPIIVAVAILAGKGELRPRVPAWTATRSLCLAAMYVAIYAGIPVVDLSVIAAALYTGPLFTTMFAAILLRERIGVRRWIAILVGFAGILIVIRPAAEGFVPAALIPVLAAALYALAAIITRSKCRHEAPITLALGLNYALLLTGLAATGATALIAKIAPDTIDTYPFLLGPWVALGPGEWGIVTLLGVLIVAIGVGLAKAYQSGQPAVIASFDYSYILFATFWGYVLFGEIPDGTTVAGLFLVLLSGLLVMGAHLPFHRRKPASSNL